MVRTMAETLSAVNWAAIIAAVGMLGSMIGAMLSVVYKLIVGNIGKTTALYDERCENLMTTFKVALESRDQMERERISRYNDQVNTLARRQGKLENELREILKEMPKTYVAREDFLKSVTVLEMKLDRIGENIFQMAKEK